MAISTNKDYRPRKYSFGGGLLVGSLIGGYLGYKIGKHGKQTAIEGFETEKKLLHKTKTGAKHLGKKLTKGIKYDEGGNVSISDEDLARIQQAVAQASPQKKGFMDNIVGNSPLSQQNQVSQKEAMQFVKENPEVLKLLLLRKGGKIDSENYQMLRGKIKEVEHHAKELKSITNRKKEVPAWVLAKSTRASTDMSDITHYMDSAKFEKGGDIDFMETQINDINNWDNEEIANFLQMSESQVANDRNRYIREAQSVYMLSSYGNGGNIGFNALANKVAKRYEGKKVAPKYQGEYGKRYSRNEAKEVGKKVAGKVYWQQQGRKFDDGGITDYDWANEFRKTKTYYVVLFAEENGKEEFFEGNVQARNEAEALYEARKGFEFNYPKKKIIKVKIDSSKDKNKYENGGGIDGLSDLIKG
jgi:hypothetical protein